MDPEQVSKAIGRGGFNIRLAGQLTGYEIDVFREGAEEDVELTEFSDEIEEWVLEELKKAGLDTANSNISTNTSNISTNTSNISTNTGNISTNASGISTNAGNISTNTGNISTNASGISTNASNISSNTSAIATINAKDPVLTLSGDASGTATFTNLGNATLSVTVADDSHAHVIANVDGLQSALNAKAPLASPALTGNPTAPTQTGTNDSTRIATTAFVQGRIDDIIGNAGSTLDTLG